MVQQVNQLLNDKENISQKTRFIEQNLKVD